MKAQLDFTSTEFDIKEYVIDFLKKAKDVKISSYGQSSRKITFYPSEESGDYLTDETTYTIISDTVHLEFTVKGNEHKIG
jgi:hypothetical protein